jgi:hypothetical protein
MSKKEDKHPLKEGSLTGEQGRAYEYTFFATGQTVNIEFERPMRVFYGMGHAFHRVQDGEGTWHLCHAPGPIRDWDGNIVGLCKVTWKSAECRW